MTLFLCIETTRFREKTGKTGCYVVGATLVVALFVLRSDTSQEHRQAQPVQKKLG